MRRSAKGFCHGLCGAVRTSGGTRSAADLPAAVPWKRGQANTVRLTLVGCSGHAMIATLLRALLIVLGALVSAFGAFVLLAQ